MISSEVLKLENENQVLKEELRLLKEQMEAGEAPKPKNCQYCRNFIQYYRKNRTTPDGYSQVCAGHCVCDVPVSKGRKKNPKPDDCCPYFELGTRAFL